MWQVEFVDFFHRLYQNRLVTLERESVLLRQRVEETKARERHALGLVEKREASLAALGNAAEPGKARRAADLVADAELEAAALAKQAAAFLQTRSEVNARAGERGPKGRWTFFRSHATSEFFGAGLQILVASGTLILASTRFNSDPLELTLLRNFGSSAFAAHPAGKSTAQTDGPGCLVGGGTSQKRTRRDGGGQGQRHRRPRGLSPLVQSWQPWRGPCTALSAPFLSI